MALDRTAFDLLKKTVSEMDQINEAVQESFDLPTARVLEPVLGDIDFDELNPVTQSKLNDLVATYLEHVRAALEGEMETKTREIQQLKS